MKKSLYLSLVLLGVLTELINTQKMTLSENKSGIIDGYSYELWKDSGNTYMELLGAGKFSCSWSNVGNALFRIGKQWDSAKTWNQLGTISVDYSVDYNPQGNSYLCVYGWTRNPLNEFYIVESWGARRLPGLSSQGTINVDGGTYDIYVNDKVIQPGIDEPFKQFWSVRTSKKTEGTVSLNKHFLSWMSIGFKVGILHEASLTIESKQSSGKATVKKNDIKVAA